MDLSTDIRIGTSTACFPGWEQQYPGPPSLHRWKLYCFTRGCRSITWPSYAEIGTFSCLLLILFPQNMPRPRGADAAGLLLRELELHPPAEEWHKRNMFGGPWSDTDDTSLSDDSTKYSSSMDLLDSGSSENGDVYRNSHLVAEKA
ncbi:UNVERIFIED_CONTAM: Mediator of RNA polymerase II transcription subunit [Sesamum radiatum]|uniref:Mediator of RNA polymerase II transcription subunit n=1 Tax=Sesamum radiatum TaxID=300843 RepID=A0AAW2T1F5_SESRA